MSRWFGARSIVCMVGVFCLLSGASSRVAWGIADDLELYVAPQGRDTASGTADQPLATIAEAQSRLRAWRTSHDSAGDAHVWIAEGTYQLERPLEFTQDDNAPSTFQTTYEALPGHHVVLRGGVSLPKELWEDAVDDRRIPEEARPHVRSIQLADSTLADWQAHHPRRARHSTMHPVPLELFCGDHRLPVAGWPNHDWARLEAVDSPRLKWSVTGLRPVDQPQAVRAHGFWQHDWQDSCEPVTISTHHAMAEVAMQDQHSAQVNSLRPGARFRIENLISELDSPGEWYCDPSQQRLYAWLPDDAASSELFVSTLDTPVSFYDCKNLTLRGLVIEGARASCVEVVGGVNVRLEHCQLRHAGNLGAHIYHGEKHCVSHCEITSTGAGAIRVEGGHRESLQACGHVIEHNRLHDYAQLHLAYRPAVNVYGVGVSVRHNAIYDAPHAAIILHGNDHAIEDNEIHHVCQMTDDVGAIYLAHNPTFRGNVIRRNYIHDLGGFSQTGVMGIYLDDFASGTEVTHNVLERACRGVAIGGGRDNLVENNVFLECLAAVQIDNRGTTWASAFVKGNASPVSRYLDEIAEHFELFVQRYPQLATLRTDAPEMAKGNRIQRNVFDAPIGIDLHDGLNESLVRVKDNFGDAKAWLVQENRRTYAPRSGSQLATSGFEAIDYSGVGPVVASSSTATLARE